MAEYITKEQALLIIDRDKRDNLLMQAEIRHVRSADVIERSKVDKAIEEMKKEVYEAEDFLGIRKDVIAFDDVLEILKRNIGE